MLLLLLRTLAELGSATNSIAFFCALIAVAFVVYIGITLWITLRTSDPERREIRYQMFTRLLDLFNFRRWR